MAKTVFMLTNCQSETYPDMLYAGLGYVLEDSEADNLVKNNLAIYLNEESDGVSKVDNSSKRRSGNSSRGKRLSKSGRLKRGRKNINNDKSGNA
jgi:hypothetical protein